MRDLSPVTNCMTNCGYAKKCIFYDKSVTGMCSFITAAGIPGNITANSCKYNGMPLNTEILNQLGCFASENDCRTQLLKVVKK